MDTRSDGIGKRKAVQSPTVESTGFLVRSANRAIQRALERRISLFGVSPGQWYFLRLLWEEDGLTQRDLSARAGMTEPTAVVALNGMEKAKLIRRVRSEKDRRKSLVFLTKKGTSLRDVMLPVATEVNSVATGSIQPSHLAILQQVLLKIVDNLDGPKT